MFAPSSSRPPFFTPSAQLAWTSNDLPQPTGVQRPRTARSPPPFHTEAAPGPVTRRKRKRVATLLGRRTAKLISTQPATQLTAALSTHSLLHTLSAAIHDTPTPSQTTSQTLYSDLLTVASHPSTQQGAGSNGRHKHALLLRLILSSVLWVEMQGKGKEELDLVDNCCSHLAGLLVLSLNGRASQSDDGAVIRTKRTERPNGGKLTVAEELHVYRTAMLARALPACLQNNARTLYHISLVGVQTDWAALAALLPSLPHLHHLHIQQCDITDQAASGVLSALSGSGVTHLSLSGNRLTDTTIRPLCRLVISQGLRREDIEWQWRLRLNEQPPAQRGRRRRSDAKAKEVKNDAVREQGLLSVDISGNCITDNGMLRLIDTLTDDCWLLAVQLHDNALSDKAVAAFFGMLAHNTTLLHYSIMPVSPPPPIPGYPPTSPRSRPTSPRAVASSAPHSSRLWSPVSSLSDPHFHIRCAATAELHRRQLLLCPRLSLNDQSAARFGHGMRGQRDVQVVAAAEPNRLLAAVETARLVPWDKLLRQRQDDLRPAQRADSRLSSAALSRSRRSLSPPAAHLRPNSASSSASVRSARPLSSAARPTAAATAHSPNSAKMIQPTLTSTEARAGGSIKPLPLALLDSLFKQLEAIDSAPSTSRQPMEHGRTQQPTDSASSVSTSALSWQAEGQGRVLPSQDGGRQLQSAKVAKGREEQKEDDSEKRTEEAEWKELRQWANERQKKGAAVESSGNGDAAAQSGEAEEEVQEEHGVQSTMRPGGQLLSLSDLLDDD